MAGTDERELAAGRDRDVIAGAGKQTIPGHLAAGRGLPDAKRCVLAGREDLPAIGRDIHCQDFAAMAGHPTD